MDSELFCNSMNVVAVVALAAIVLLVTAAWLMIRAPAWTWLWLGWMYALGVRFYVMLTGFGLFDPPAYTTINALMSAVYVLLVIGIFAIVKDLRRIWRRMKEKDEPS